MLIIDNNLSGLAAQESICDSTLVEKFCLTIRLGREVHRLNQGEDGMPLHVIYDHSPEPSTLFSKVEYISQNLDLAPRESVLACTDDFFRMPRNCFGLLQTKGTLARTFVSVTCNDGQVEPGFEGKITLEITNQSPWKVSIPVRASIGQLYLFRCTTATTEMYSGRYAELAKLGPTLPRWGR